MNKPSAAQPQPDKTRTIRVTFQANLAEYEALIARFGKGKRGKRLMRDALLCTGIRPQNRASQEWELVRARAFADLHLLARWIENGQHNGTPLECAEACISLAKLAARLEYGH
jgi:hypothetical protein